MKAPVASDPDFEDAAQEAALAWLGLIDDAQYRESWEQAASLFKCRISRSRWIGAIRSTQAPFGKVQSRSFLRAVYDTRLPGVPDGKYVVIRYRTAFEHKEEAVETVTPMLDQDGIWRVSGYFI
ncbi:MAG: DUF4019 domain-containing protein [Alphaproteobacteria bacterium]|nr:DUF4019 domain-containing protein [Alphaproteobacteria bacterium]